jgi:aspartate kinase
MAALTKAQATIGFEALQSDDQIGKVSLVGAGMRTHPGVTARYLSALAAAGINVEMISTSQIRISVVVREDQLPAAVAALHTAFDLDSAHDVATVYGGSGR